MKISFARVAMPGTGAVVAAVTEGAKLNGFAHKLDQKLDGALSRAIKKSYFDGKLGQQLNIIAPFGSRIDEVILLGLGKASELTELEVQKLGGAIYTKTNRAKSGIVYVILENVAGSGIAASKMAAQIAYGARLRSYRFDKYKTKQKSDSKPNIKNLNLLCSGSKAARDLFRKLDKIV